MVAGERNLGEIIQCEHICGKDWAKIKVGEASAVLFYIYIFFFVYFHIPTSRLLTNLSYSEYHYGYCTLHRSLTLKGNYAW